MLEFNIDKEKCTRCGLCVNDCVAKIIELSTGWPHILKKKESLCFRCQHCLAICPTGAVSILGRNPEESTLLQGNFPDPDQLEILIKGRRSVRQYKDENINPELMQRLLDLACQAPTGGNARKVQLSVIDDKEVLNRFREQTYAGLAKLIETGKLPEGRAVFAHFVHNWQKNKVDILFRGAPHIIIASAPRKISSPVPDCVIALSYFELFANSLGVGTVWNGLVRYAVDKLLPAMRRDLSIPENHLVGGTIAFGSPMIKYQRTVENDNCNVVRCRS